jgi:hypothetical protein
MSTYYASCRVNDYGHPVNGVIEEANEGLGELAAVVRVGDEEAPSWGDAIAVEERLDGQPRQDIDHEVIGEVGGRVPRTPLLGSLGHLAAKLASP